VGPRPPLRPRMGLLLASRDRRVSAAWWPQVTTPTARRRRAFLYLFVVAAFLAVTYRVETQDRQIQRFLDEQCEDRRSNVVATIELRRQLAAVSDRAEAKVYQARTLIVPRCQ
jgi:hypothetical protein